MVYGCRACNAAGRIKVDRALFHSNRCLRYYNRCRNLEVQESVLRTVADGCYLAKHEMWGLTKACADLGVGQSFMALWVQKRSSLNLLKGVYRGLRRGVLKGVLRGILGV